MPFTKTTEELLASRINPRNPSSVLSAIYFLKRRANSDYVPSSPSRIIWGATNIGEGSGTSKSFTVISPSTYDKGDEITLEGTANFNLTQGATNIKKATIKIVAQIDIGNTDSGFPAYQVEALISEINSDGTFSFKIPASITNQMASGAHTVYLDAFSPNGAARLEVSGIDDGVQTFVIN